MSSNHDDNVAAGTTTAPPPSSSSAFRNISSSNNIPTFDGDDKAKATDFANYFCAYAQLYHQKQMLTDHNRMVSFWVEYVHLCICIYICVCGDETFGAENASYSILVMAEYTA